MELIFSGLWVSNEIIQAICLTLIHSLWQGFLIAILAGVIIFFSKKVSSYVRYFLLTGVLALFLLISIITFFIQLQHIQHSGNQTGTATISYSENPGQPINNYSSIIAKKDRFVDKVENFSNRNADYIVAIWFIILLFHCVRLASGMHYIHRIRYTKTVNPPDEWKRKLLILTDNMGLRQRIALLQSAIVKMPVVIGILKPVILLPVGLLASISNDQVEAILLHELAHIKRKDFLVNFLQSLADAIFFFNPGFIWLSSLIRSEREACCDEIALSRGIDKHIYLEALISFQETRVMGKYAMTFGSRRAYLLDRVQKILTRENKKLNYMEKVLLLAGIISITAFGFIARQKETKNDLITSIIDHKSEHKMSLNSQMAGPSFQSTSTDTLPKKNKTIIEDAKKLTIIKSDYDGKNYMITRTGNEITSISIDGESIPKKDFGKYKSIIQEIEEKEQRETELSREELRHKNIEMKRELDEYARARHEHEDAYRKEMIERDLEMHRELIERKHNQDQEVQEKMRQLRKEMENLEQMKKSGNNADELKEKQLVLEKIMADLNSRQSSEQSEMREKMQQMERNLQARQERELKYRKLGLENDDEIHSIIEDLYHHNIISSHEPLSFRLNRNELIVNGKTQSQEIQKELKEKYIHKEGDLFNYVHEKGSTSITIHRD